MWWNVGISLMSLCVLWGFFLKGCAIRYSRNSYLSETTAALSLRTWCPLAPLVPSLPTCLMVLQQYVLVPRHMNTYEVYI